MIWSTPTSDWTQIHEEEKNPQDSSKSGYILLRKSLIRKGFFLPSPTHSSFRREIARQNVAEDLENTDSTLQYSQKHGIAQTVHYEI